MHIENSDLRNNTLSNIMGDLNPPANVSLRYASCFFYTHG